LYNAHLEVVHASVGEVATTSAAVPSNSTNSSKGRVDEAPIVEYTSFGGPAAQNAVKSRAEEMSAQRRVKKYNLTFHPSFGDLTDLF
jgi:hypothetical protein